MFRPQRPLTCIATPCYPCRTSVRHINRSCYDISTGARFPMNPPDALLGTLAEFRYELRRFLHFSEQAAMGAGIQPRQHQLLLQVAGASESAPVTITYAAERLGLKHNSAVELVNRSESEGLLERSADPKDKRRAILRVTRKGRQLLSRLAGDHARELNEMAPRLEKALKHIRQHTQDKIGAGDR